MGEVIEVCVMKQRFLVRDSQDHDVQGRGGPLGMAQSKGRCGMNRLGQLETGSQVVSNEDVEPGLNRSVNLAGHGRIVAHDVELGNQQTPSFFVPTRGVEPRTSPS